MPRPARNRHVRRLDRRVVRLLGATQYAVTIADPAVIVDADGQGEITAVVSAFNVAGNGSR